jgi:hypothetical protein
MSLQVELDRGALKDFCHRWHVRELSIFGSALREDFGPESDLDFLVSFEPGAPWSLFDLMEMKEDLETRLGHAVDLVEKEAIRNPWRKRDILGTCEVLYAA